ncbi:hypothetical protein [Jeotgalibacillus soli]|uniref:Uncharacterized protein n=1 Tax=Jeotgalibacillus soli TaxID=889306 RepID=A0A0C2VKF6_9BACL|nr:hypothetical protein [Jeotgalibacillus soli]KIL49382.1 hypothetical protein KP78_08500 [Jeotgalibacillus soli]
MQTHQTTGKELIEKWIVQNVISGKTSQELSGTLFVYGDEAMTLTSTETGSLEIITEEVSNVVVFRKKNESDATNMCRACGVDHSTFKEALECCADID